MTIHHALSDDSTLTVAPEGRLDSTTADEFSACIGEYFTGEVKTLKLDFSGVDFISSKGLRVLVSVYKQLAGRSMVITGANSSVREVFRISGLLRVFCVE